MTSEKRLIDANALLKDFAERQNQDRCEGDLPDCFMNYADALSTEWWCIEEAIANAPTIDAVPVRHGLWVEIGADKRGRGGIFRCTNCNDCHPHTSKRCSNCGAIMKGVIKA